MKKIRLDQLVFDKGLAESRERAKAYIMAGSVYVNGQKETKPGTSRIRMRICNICQTVLPQ